MYCEGDAKIIINRLIENLSIENKNSDINIKKEYNKIIDNYYSNGDIDSLASNFLKHIMNLLSIDNAKIFKNLKIILEDENIIKSLNNTLKHDQLILSIDEKINSHLI